MENRAVGNGMTELARRLTEDIDSGLSRRDIAHKAKVSEATVRNALAGETLSHGVVERFARYYFRVSVEEMYRLAGLLPPATEAQLTYQEEKIIKAIQCLRGTPYYGQTLNGIQQVLDVIMALMDAPE